MPAGGESGEDTDSLETGREVCRNTELFEEDRRGCLPVGHHLPCPEHLFIQTRKRCAALRGWSAAARDEEIPHGSEQVTGLRRLADERAEAGGGGRFAILTPRVCRQRERRHERRGPGQRPDPPHQREPVFARQPDVRDHGVEGLNFGEFERGGRRSSRRRRSRRRIRRVHAAGRGSTRRRPRRAGCGRPVRSGRRCLHPQSSARSGRTAGTGTSTEKVLPRPSPSLWAQTRPPCSSTRCFTIASPSPRPPWPRVVGLVRLAEAVEHVGQELAARCRRRCRCTATTTCDVGAARPALDTRPPLGRELHGVGQQVPEHLLQPVGVSPGRRSDPPEDVHVERDPLGLSRGPQRPRPRRRPRRRASTGCDSRRSLPVMMRDTSSRSSTSCAWARALRSMISSRALHARRVDAGRCAASRSSRGWR